MAERRLLTWKYDVILATTYKLFGIDSDPGVVVIKSTPSVLFSYSCDWVADFSHIHADSRQSHLRRLKPGFHPNAIACVACIAFGWKPGKTQALALASSQSWLPLLRPSIPGTFSPVSIQTQRTQRKRLRLDKNQAWRSSRAGCIFEVFSQTGPLIYFWGRHFQTALLTHLFSIKENNDIAKVSLLGSQKGSNLRLKCSRIRLEADAGGV